MSKRIEDIENHMVIEDLYYEGDGFVRESDFEFDDDLDNFDSVDLYDKDSEGNPVIHVNKEVFKELQKEVLTYRGTRPDIDGEFEEVSDDD